MIKFRPYQFVKVADEMPPHMSHFEKGFIGIVAGTYAELHGASSPHDFKIYCVYLVSDAKVVTRASWYEESQLSDLNLGGDAHKLVYEYLSEEWQG